MRRLRGLGLRCRRSLPEREARHSAVVTPTAQPQRRMIEARPSCHEETRRLPLNGPRGEPMEFLSKDSRTLQTNESGGNKLCLKEAGEDWRNTLVKQGAGTGNMLAKDSL